LNPQPGEKGFFPLHSLTKHALLEFKAMVILLCRERWIALLERCIITFGLLLEKLWKECCNNAYEPAVLAAW